MLGRVARFSSRILTSRVARCATVARRAPTTTRGHGSLLAKWTPVRFHSSGSGSFEELSKTMEQKLRAGLKDVKHVAIQDARGMEKQYH